MPFPSVFEPKRSQLGIKLLSDPRKNGSPEDPGKCARGEREVRGKAGSASSELKHQLAVTGAPVPVGGSLCSTDRRGGGVDRGGGGEKGGAGDKGEEISEKSRQTAAPPCTTSDCHARLTMGREPLHPSTSSRISKPAPQT